MSKVSDLRIQEPTDLGLADAPDASRHVDAREPGRTTVVLDPQAR